MSKVVFFGTKLDSNGERSSGCECYSWMLIPANTMHSGRTVGKYFDEISRPNTSIGQKWLNWPTVQGGGAGRGSLLPRHEHRAQGDR